ncbi:xylulokinase [Microbacterium sp. KSW4-17]|uniref:Xylulose kinase n=1 Tax=Microbacterium galbum TaxID=3075994 RepID=A0ABU3T9K2_9MICO|nr:xylulokinase [Microbacterium sp. KSW4-17]MDU0368027.1 xylulokinase [Microbacterium sp. KSW4-17]
MALVMGVDSSTQSCKVVVVDAETGRVVREGRASHPAGTSVDPEAWWIALQDAIARAGGLDDIAAVSIAGQQHGMVALDAEGAVIRDALLWNDTRSAPAARDLIDEVGAAEFAERTGAVPVASFTGTKLRWLRDAEPDNAARVAAVALPHDWLTWRLRGFGPGNAVLEELVTDRSDASGTAYWGAGGYDDDLFVRALGHDAVRPRVLGPWESAGTLPGGALVGPGAGDNAGAALGLGAGVGDVVVSLGTSGTVFAVSDTPSRDTTGTVAGFADATGKFLPLVATLNAARVLDAFAGLLGVTHDELGALALQAEPGADGVVLVPWFEGERTPNLPNAQASLTGLTLASTNRPTLARAAIEGMLSGLAVGLEAIQAQGVEVRRVLLIGGAAANDGVARIAAQVFDAEIVVPAAGEYVALGAARQAAGVRAGGPVEWTVATTRAVEPDHRPQIRARYDAVAALRAQES